MMLRVSIRVGRRMYSEVIDETEERNYLEETNENAVEDGGKPVTWKRWTRPIKWTPDTAISRLSGNHFLYGWYEGINQSDASPMFALTEFNKEKKVELCFETIDA